MRTLNSLSPPVTLMLALTGACLVAVMSLTQANASQCDAVPYTPGGPTAWSAIVTDQWCEVEECKRCEGAVNAICPLGQECDHCEFSYSETSCQAHDDTCCQSVAGDIPPPNVGDCGMYMVGACDGFDRCIAFADPAGQRCKRRWCRQVSCP